MPIYKMGSQKATKLSLKSNGFGNEFELRDFFANNLEELLSVRFLEKEYTIPDARIDTIGIDENDSPVIIEYKWKENEEVFTQGLSYLAWLLKNKKEFTFLVKNKFGDEADVNWDQPRVILIAQEFGLRIKLAVQTHENVELKTYAVYDDNILHIENEYSPRPEKKLSEKKHVNLEHVTNYDLNYHLNITSPEMRKVFEILRNKILELSDVEEKSGQKTGVTYRTTRSFTRFEFRGTWIQLLLRDYNYADDSRKIIKDISANEWGLKGKIELKTDSDIEYVFSLIRASYNSTL